MAGRPWYSVAVPVETRIIAVPPVRAARVEGPLPQPVAPGAVAIGVVTAVDERRPDEPATMFEVSAVGKTGRCDVTASADWGPTECASPAESASAAVEHGPASAESPSAPTEARSTSAAPRINGEGESSNYE